MYISLVELCALAESTVLIAEGDYVERSPFRHSGYVAQQRPGGSIQIHPHTVDAAFHHRLQRLLQLPLIDVVLILPHPD